MADFLTGLARRTLGLTPVVQPMIASVFANNANNLMMAADYSSVWEQESESLREQATGNREGEQAIGNREVSLLESSAELVEQSLPEGQANLEASYPQQQDQLREIPLAEDEQPINKITNQISNHLTSPNYSESLLSSGINLNYTDSSTDNKISDNPTRDNYQQSLLSPEITPNYTESSSNKISAHPTSPNYQQSLIAPIAAEIDSSTND
ncbi:MULTISPECIES: hypothetical protein, partial [unclassified Moorena]